MFVASFEEIPISRENQERDYRNFVLNFASVKETEDWVEENKISMYRTDGQDNWQTNLLKLEEIPSENEKILLGALRFQRKKEGCPYGHKFISPSELICGDKSVGNSISIEIVDGMVKIFQRSKAGGTSFQDLPISRFIA